MSLGMSLLLGLLPILGCAAGVIMGYLICSAEDEKSGEK
jgi:hypothetical protein